MKNSKKSQIIFFIIFFALFFAFSTMQSNNYENIGAMIIAALGMMVVALATMIYLIICSKKKIVAIIIDFIAILVGAWSFFDTLSALGSAIESQGDKLSIDEQMLWAVEGFGFALTFNLLVIFVTLVIMFIVSFIPSGYFSKNATCAICGKKIGINRQKIGKTVDGKYIWKCSACTQKGGLLNIDYVTGKATLIDNKDTEVRMKCNVCGHIYCYTYADLERNQKLAKSAVTDSILGVGEAVGGTRIGSQIATARAESKLDKIVDFSKCPHCNSSDVRSLSAEEYEREKATPVTNNNSVASISTAEELKKFKDLLDGGVITQEEFDAKKKQLLGL